MEALENCEEEVVELSVQIAELKKNKEKLRKNQSKCEEEIVELGVQVASIKYRVILSLVRMIF